MYCNIIIIISNSISISIWNNVTITISVKVNISVNITSTFSINIDINTTSLNWLDMAKSMIGPGFDKNILWKRRFFTRMEIIRSAAFFIHFRKANMKWQQICLNFWKRSRFSFLISKADKEAISWHQNMEIKSELDLVLQKETWWDGSLTCLVFRVALAVARSRNISFYEDCLFTAECNCKLTAAVVTSPRTTQTQSWHGSGEHFIEPVCFLASRKRKHFFGVVFTGPNSAVGYQYWKLTNIRYAQSC